MWIIVRLCGIVIGIATLLRLATMQGLVTYDPLFQQWMDWLSDIVELGFLTKLIGPFLHWGIDWVRSFGMRVPDLQDEWRPAFVLSTLMCGAMARHGRIWWLGLAAPLVALAIAVWSGLIGLLAPVGLLPLAAASAIFAIAGRAARSSSPGFFAGVLSHLAWVAALGTASVGALVLLTLLGAGPLVSFIRPSPVENFAVLIAFAGVMLLVGGLIRSVSGGWRAVCEDASFNIGVDILGVMLGALGIASLFANPPIW